MKWPSFPAVSASIILLLAAGSKAERISPDMIAVELGYGSGIDNTKLLRVTGQWDVGRVTKVGGHLELRAVAEALAGVWRGNHDIVDIAVTPIFRLQGAGSSRSIRPYFEGATGFHYISRTKMRNRDLSTNFQFGDHLGIGAHMRKLDVCYLFQHLSNGSIKGPNAGINFHILRVGMNLN